MVMFIFREEEYKATEENQGIAEVIRDKAPQGIRIYSDEVYENILFDGAEHNSIAALPGMEDKTIIVSSLTAARSWEPR